MSIPNPADYKSWQEWGAALVRTMGDSTGGIDPASLPARGEVIPPVNLPSVPDGYKPVWLSDDETKLFMGNSDYDPPTTPDLFQIDTAKLADAAVSLLKLQDDSVSAAKILTAAVGVLELASAAVTAAKVATDAIASANIQTGAVVNAKLGDLSVDALKLAALAVQTSKVSDAAIVTTKINDAAITTAKIGLLAVGNAQIAALAVGTAQIADAAIVNVKIGSAAVQTSNIGTAQITTALVADATIISGKIVDANVLTAKIANAAIISALIGDAQVVTAKIADLAVDVTKIANATITGAKIANASIGAAHILTAAIGTAAIQDAAITNAKVGNTIQSASWNATTKSGWLIDKLGNIQGSSLTLYDAGGNVILSSGGLGGIVSLPWEQVSGAGRPDSYATVGDNLLPNAAFATDSAGTAVDLWSNTGSGEAFARVTDNSSAGAYLHCTTSAAATQANNNQFIQCIGGQLLYPSLWCRSNRAVNWAYVGVAFYDATGANVSGSYVGQASCAANNAWSYWKGTALVVPSTATYMLVSLQPVDAVGGGGFYYDFSQPRFAATESGATVGATYGVNTSGFGSFAGISQVTTGTQLADALIGAIKLQDAAIAFGSAKTSGFGALAGLSTASRTGGYLTGFGAVAGQDTLSYSGGFLTGFGTLAAASQITTTSQLASGVVNSSALADGTVTGTDMAAGTITATQLADAVIAFGSSKLSGFGNLAALNTLALGGGYLTGFGSLAGLSSVGYGSSYLSGFGTFAAISLLTSGNISTYISGAAIGSALIANAAIGTAHINTASVTSALIADAAIGTAKIADASITSAKVIDLVVNKITSGTLDAVIDVGTGMLKFSIGGSALYIGRGFGTSSQFVMWFGSSTIATTAAAESNATFYLKTDGSAYFGGALTSGILTNRVTSSDTSTSVSTTVGPFGSNGDNRVVTVGYTFERAGVRTGDQTSSTSGTMSATLALSGDASGSGSAAGSMAELYYDSEFDRTHFRTTMSGGFTVTDTSGGLGPINYTAASDRTGEIAVAGTAVGVDTLTQRLSIVSVEG